MSREEKKITYNGEVGRRCETSMWDWRLLSSSLESRQFAGGRRPPSHSLHTDDTCPSSQSQSPVALTQIDSGTISAWAFYTLLLVLTSFLCICLWGRQKPWEENWKSCWYCWYFLALSGCCAVYIYYGVSGGIVMYDWLDWDRVGQSNTSNWLTLFNLDCYDRHS